MRASLILPFVILPMLACEKKPDAAAKGKRGKKDIPVRTERAESIERARTISLVAVLEGRKQAQVYARVAGKVSQIAKGEGERVKEGDILFRVDRSEPGESFLATPVVSPINGWVGRWLVTSLGAQVSAQDPVVAVVDDVALRGRVLLPSEQWQLMTVDTKAYVTAGREERQAKVIGISRSAEIQSSRGTITVEVANDDHRWKAGMIATVRFDLDVRPRVVLPASAVSITDQGNYIFVVEAAKAVRLPVSFSIIDNDSVEITKGLDAGKEVIVQGVNQVGDGVAVTVVPKKDEGKKE